MRSKEFCNKAKPSNKASLDFRSRSTRCCSCFSSLISAHQKQLNTKATNVLQKIPSWKSTQPPVILHTNTTCSEQCVMKCQSRCLHALLFNCSYNRPSGKLMDVRCGLQGIKESHFPIWHGKLLQKFSRAFLSRADLGIGRSRTCTKLSSLRPTDFWIFHPLAPPGGLALEMRVLTLEVKTGLRSPSPAVNWWDNNFWPP